MSFASFYIHLVTVPYVYIINFIQYFSPSLINTNFFHVFLYILWYIKFVSVFSLLKSIIFVSSIPIPILSFFSSTPNHNCILLLIPSFFNTSYIFSIIFLYSFLLNSHVK